MARRKGAKGRREGAARRQEGRRGDRTSDLLEPEARAEEEPAADGGRDGTAFMAGFVALSALVTGLLLSGWTPHSLGSQSAASSAGGVLPAGTNASTRTVETEPVVKPGSVPAKRIFGVYCGTCHTLGDAGAQGTVGPNLDRLRPSFAQTLRAIRVGGRGSGQMPPNVVVGRSAERVAAYVARAAG